MRIANSFRRGGSELLKRMYSPIFCERSASSGLRSNALNGPRTPPRGPPAISWYTLRCASSSSPADSCLNRGASCASVPSETSAAANAPRYAFISPSSRDPVYGNVHQGNAVHRSRRPREMARGGSAALRRHAAGHALRGVPLVRLPAASQPGRLPQPVALHAEAAMGLHSRRRDGDRAAGRQLARLQAGRALLLGGCVARRGQLQRESARPLERPARRSPARHAVRKGLTLKPPGCAPACPAIPRPPAAPPEVFTSTAVGFIRASSRLPIMWRVSSVRGTWSVSKSASGSRSSRLDFRSKGKFETYGS